MRNMFRFKYKNCLIRGLVSPTADLKDVPTSFGDQTNFFQST